MTEMRTKNSIRNATVSIIMTILMSLIGLIAQKIFINILGTEYLGISGLFSNIISMLGIVELGIGPAIIYNLYRPLKENNLEKVKSLVYFYKKCYSFVALAILGIGVLIIPFLPYIMKGVTITENVAIIYILFLLDTFVSYLAAYKQSILYANQENYIINIIHIGYLVIMNFLQLLFLYLTHDYYLYLIIKITCRLAENIIISYVTSRKYPEIFQGSHKPIDKKTSKGIFKRTKGLIYHKIGTFIVDGSDNIIISTFLGVKAVGLYTNYSLILNAVNNLMNQAFSAITASVGNLLVDDEENKKYNVFKNIYFINFCLASIISICFLCTIQPFITIWIGTDFILSTLIIITLAFNLYIKLMTRTMNTFQEAAGIFYEDRFVPLAQSIINVAFSIILLHFFGMAGVFMGTIISYLLLHFYSYPKYVYKSIFSQNLRKYFIQFFKYFILTIIIGLISFYIVNVITFSNILIQIIFNIVISFILINLIIFIFFHSTEEYNYCLQLVKNFFVKKRRKA